MATVTPGKVFAEDERVTRAKLNQLGNPTVTINDGEIGVDQLQEGAVRQLAPYPSRNVLINGNFDVWQRGGFFSVSLPQTLGTSADPEYGADRWYLGEPSGASKREISRQMFTVGQTTVPNEPTYYLQWNQLVAETGDYRPILSQPIEDVRTLAGKDAVVTWWMKGNYSGTITCRMIQYFGDVVGPPSYPARTLTATTGGSAVLASGADWVQYTATFSITNLVGYGIEGDNHSLKLQFLLPDNTTFLIDFAQIQLEQGTTPTDFEVLPVLDTFLKCERYFEYTGGVAASDVSTAKPSFFFTTKKYRAPDLTLISGYAGTMTEANFATILDVGYFQNTANSVVSAFFMQADAEIY